VENSNFLNKVKGFLGFSDEFDTEEDMEFEQQPMQNHQQQYTQQVQQNNESDDFNRRRKYNSNRNSNIVELTQNTSFNQVIIVEPRNYDDAIKVVNLLRSKVAVIVNFVNTSLSDTDTMHIIDFICGAVCAIDGNQKIVSPSVYLFAPGNINIDSLESEHHGSLNKSGNNLFLTVDDIVGERISRAS